MLTDGPYGHTVGELRQSDIEKAVRSIELERDKRRGLVPKQRTRRKPEAYDGLHAAFARAAEERRELQRLKGSRFDYDDERIDA